MYNFKMEEGSLDNCLFFTILRKTLILCSNRINMIYTIQISCLCIIIAKFQKLIYTILLKFILYIGRFTVKFVYLYSRRIPEIVL